MITANPKGFQGVDERIRSRLMDVSLVEQVNFDRAPRLSPTSPQNNVGARFIALTGEIAIYMHIVTQGPDKSGPYVVLAFVSCRCYHIGNVPC